MTDDEVLQVVTKLYQWRSVSKRWTITGYKCPYCEHHYHSLRKQLFDHIKTCEGPKEKRSLED